MVMRIWGRRGLPALLAAMTLTLLVAACDPAPESRPESVSVANVPASRVSAPVAAVPAGLVATLITVPAGYGAPFDTPRSVLVPPGWRMSVWVRLPEPRLAAWTPDGALLVSMPGDGEVVRLTPTPAGTAMSSVLISGLDQPHGLAFAGSTLYVAQSNRVDAFDYSGGRVSAPRPVVTGLPDAKSPDLHGAYAHALKSVAVGRDGAVYISVGSIANISPADRTATPPQASILRVPPAGGPPQEFTTGVRNGTGLAIGPDGAVWTAVNERDDIEYPFDRPYGSDDAPAQGRVVPGYVRDHPAEAIARLTPGRDLGWPYCNPDPDTEPGLAESPLNYASMRFTRDQQTNPDGSKLDCSRLAPVEQGIGAHSAPLGLSFTTSALPDGWGSGALIGVHGSWNRTPPRAPEVSFYPWISGTLGPQRTLVGGFQAPDGSRWGRPVAPVQGPDGAVYITDDFAGAVYRLAPPGR
jgi:glucose/arabinose dehydrogenase